MTTPEFKKYVPSMRLCALREAIESTIRQADSLEAAEISAVAAFQVDQIIEWQYGMRVVRGRVINLFAAGQQVAYHIRIILKSGKDGGTTTVFPNERPVLSERQA